MLRIPAAAAAIATLLAVFLTAVYLRFSDDDNGAGSRGIPIVVAARDIPAGTRISADMLAFVEGQGDALPFGMPPDPLVGQVTTVSIAQGERITASKITRIASLSADLVYSVDVSSEGCGPSRGSGGITTDPIAQTLQRIRHLNTSNQPNPSTAKATRSTWDTAHAIVQARGASIIKTCEPQCSPDDHTKAWIVEVHGTFVPQEEPISGSAIVPDSIQAGQPPSRAPIAGTWFSIIPVFSH